MTSFWVRFENQLETMQKWGKKCYLGIREKVGRKVYFQTPCKMTLSPSILEGHSDWKNPDLHYFTFLSNHLKSGPKLTDLEWAFKWSGKIIAWPFKTRPFEIQSSKSLDFKCFWILNGWISDFPSKNVDTAKKCRI